MNVPRILSPAVLSAVTLGASVLFLGCADPSSDDAPASPDEGAQVQDLVSRGGVTLTAAGDADLRISLLMLDGVKAKTKNKRFVKATIYRKSKSFGAFCSIRGEVSATRQVATISCNIGVATVSNDDDESLGFDVVLARGPAGESVTLAGVSYAGDGTFLGKEAGIIGHEDAAPLPLTVKEASNMDRNPLLLARSLLDATKPLLGKKVNSDEVDAPVAVKSASFSLDQKLELTTWLALGRTGRLHAELDPVSLLKSPGSLATGLLDKAGLIVRLEGALPQ